MSEQHRHSTEGFAGRSTVRVYHPDFPLGIIIPAEDYDPKDHDLVDEEGNLIDNAGSATDDEE